MQDLTLWLTSSHAAWEDRWELGSIDRPLSARHCGSNLCTQSHLSLPPALGSADAITLTLQMRKMSVKQLSELSKAICTGPSCELVSCLIDFETYDIFINILLPSWNINCHCTKLSRNWNLFCICQDAEKLWIFLIIYWYLSNWSFWDWISPFI